MKFYREEFKAARNKLRWSIVALAKECGVSRQTIFLWESGKVVPPEGKVRQLARVLNVKMNSISDLEDNIPVSGKDVTPVFNLWNSLAGSSTKSRQEKRDNIVKQVYSHLNEQEQLYAMVNALLNSLQSIFYFKDKDMKYLVANKAFLENLSLLKDYNVHGKTDSDLFSQREADKNDEEDISVFKTGKPVVNREGYIPGSKKSKWGLISKFPIFDNDNKVIGVLGNITDITQIKEFEEVQALISESLNKLDVCLSIYSLANKGYLFCNDSAYQVFGVDKSIPVENIEEYWLNNIVHPDDRDEQRRAIHAKEVPPVREYRIIHPQKGERTIKVIKTKSHNQKYTIALSIDVTK